MQCFGSGSGNSVTVCSYVSLWVCRVSFGYRSSFRPLLARAVDQGPGPRSALQVVPMPPASWLAERQAAAAATAAVRSGGSGVLGTTSKAPPPGAPPPGVANPARGPAPELPTGVAPVASAVHDPRQAGPLPPQPPPVAEAAAHATADQLGADSRSADGAAVQVDASADAVAGPALPVAPREAPLFISDCLSRSSFSPPCQHWFTTALVSSPHWDPVLRSCP